MAGQFQRAIYERLFDWRHPKDRPDAICAGCGRNGGQIYDLDAVNLCFDCLYAVIERLDAARVALMCGKDGQPMEPSPEASRIDRLLEQRMAVTFVAPYGGEDIKVYVAKSRPGRLPGVVARGRAWSVQQALEKAGRAYFDLDRIEAVMLPEKGTDG